MSNEDNGVTAPSSEPSALKSLLNPIASEGATPSSTVPEPPKSPQPNPAAVESAPIENQALPPSNGDLPPLPTDASVPPSPKAADEPPPVLPEGAIPPAVSTPSVITDGLATPALENPASAPEPLVADATSATLAPEPTPEVTAPAPVPETAPASEPAPAPSPVPPPPAALLGTAPATTEPPAPTGAIEPAPTPADPTTSAPAPPAQLPTVPASDSMDVDIPEPSPAGGLKRSGDELEGREEKRTRDDDVAAPAPQPPVQVTAPSAPVAAPVPTEQAPPAPAPAAQAPIAAPGVGTVPVVIPPPPVASGPTTPFTLTQHKHMLSCVRSLKKNKDALLFLEPVDPIRFGIPHYPDIITKPMDVSTVETKLIVSDPRGPPKDKSKMGKWDQSKGKYNSVADVSLDVRQIFWNTARFNGVDHLVTQAATRLDAVFAKMINNIPPEPVIAPPPPPPAAGPSSHARRASVSQPPVIRRTSDVTDRPKREIHPPPSKDLAYADAPRKPKRRNDPQLQWALKTLKALESTNKTYDMIAPFLYSVDSLLATFPDYASVVKRPIDLLIIKQRLQDGEYDDISQVDSDMRLMFSNASKYNAAHDPVAIAATQFQQLWAEKLRSVPPKYVSRDSSEDPIGGTPDYDSEDEHDEKRLAGYRDQIAEIEGKIEKLKSRQAQRHASRPRKPVKKAAPAPARKASGGPAYGNGSAKKARKTKEYKDDDDDEITELSPSQKEDLANKIQAADATILNKALEIIARSQDVASDGEIELDIEALPRDALLELYALVVGPIKKGRKSNYVPNGRKPGRKPGGPRKSMNEEEEVLRIARMEEQLQSFSRDPGASAQAATGYEDNDSESSEEEDSDLD